MEAFLRQRGWRDCPLPALQPQDSQYEDKGRLHQEPQGPPRLLPQEGVEGGGEGGEGETGREREANKFAEQTSQPKINEAINKLT